MEWLDKYAYRAEERIDADRALARRVYTALAARLIEHGTGCVLLFGTIKPETNLLLAEVMQEAGIRAFVGKLSMDKSTREAYREPGTSASLEAARTFIHDCRALTSRLPPHRRLVEPVLTPRFVPTSSDEQLRGLGEIAQEDPSLRIQSHLAEAQDQVNWVRSERGREDIDVFDQAKLLTNRTVQAHCTFLTDPCLDRLHERGTAVAHCPLSNMYFSAEKAFPLREALDAGVKVGLGTDIAGGYSVDIMNSMRHAVSVSRIRQGIYHEADTGTSTSRRAIDWKEALYLGTRGGAVALGLENAGRFAVGCSFDAQQIKLIDPGSRQGVGSLDFFDIADTVTLTAEIVEKWWCIGDAQNRVQVWVQGQKIG